MVQNFPINIMHILIVKQPWGCVYRNIIWLRKTQIFRPKTVILDLLLKKSKTFEWKVSLLFVVPDAKKYHHIWLR